MIFLDALYAGIATICVMIATQFIIFFGIKLMYPPPPKIIYRDVPVYQQAPPSAPVLTQPPPQEVTLPEYEPRKQTSDSIRMDVELPNSLQETRPPGL
jgi:hypothetical protein